MVSNVVVKSTWALPVGWSAYWWEMGLTTTLEVSTYRVLDGTDPTFQL
jgi:hypothetical protein